MKLFGTNDTRNLQKRMEFKKKNKETITNSSYDSNHKPDSVWEKKKYNGDEQKGVSSLKLLMNYCTLKKLTKKPSENIKINSFPRN